MSDPFEGCFGTSYPTLDDIVNKKPVRKNLTQEEFEDAFGETVLGEDDGRISDREDNQP